MTTESELRRENLELREERDILKLRVENRKLKRQIERLQKVRSAENPFSSFTEGDMSDKVATAAVVIGCIGLFVITAASIYLTYSIDG